jgi:SNF2 family DNA or RNA helicase
VYDNEFNKSIIGYKNLKLLKSQLEKCSLRRSKDLLNLPPKTIIEEYVEMDNKQNKFYTDLVNGIVDSIDKVEVNNNFILSTAIRLRQATACPSILTSENITSAKIERAVDLANQIADSGEKVVIFSTFKETTKYLYESLKHLNPVVGTGDNDDVEISNAIDTFQNDDNCKVFIGTWQKCGTGITLTAASYMIFMDTPWTYALFEQNCDRIYRIGTKKGVTIYNLITKDTVDERVLEILKDKEALSSYIIDGDISAKGLEILKKYITEEL